MWSLLNLGLYFRICFHACPDSQREGVSGYLIHVASCPLGGRALMLPLESPQHQFTPSSEDYEPVLRSDVGWCQAKVALWVPEGLMVEMGKGLSSVLRLVL